MPYNPDGTYTLSQWEKLMLRLHTEKHVRQDKMLSWLLDRLPRRFLMWCFIKVAAHGTTHQWGDTDPGTLSVIEALQRWSIPHEAMSRRRNVLT